MQETLTSRRPTALLIIALMATTVKVGIAQPQDPPPLETFAFDVAVPVTECSYDGTIDNSATTVEAPAGANFVHFGRETPGNVTSDVIQFLLWDKDRSQEDSLKYVTYNVDLDDSSRRKAFCVQPILYDKFARRTYKWGWRSAKLAVGTAAFPVKARLGVWGRQFAFASDITLGTTGGVRWRTSPQRETYFSLLFGVGISSVTLDSNNTNGEVSTPTDRSAFALNLGGMFEVERFQFGVFVGWDFISEPNQQDWVYHGAPWLSLGLGYSLLTPLQREPASN